MLTFASLRPLPALVLCAVLLCALTLPVRAATLYVSPAGSDDNSGAIASPYKTIQAAVNNASSGDTIALAYAIYQGNGNRDIDFAGKSLSIVSQSGRGKAIMDCQGMPQEPHYAFNFHSKESDVLLDGLTIKNGNNQAAVRIGQDCTIKLNQCGFRDNTGEGISNDGTAALTDCLFLSSPGSGVGNGGTASVTGCTFTGNIRSGVRNVGTATLTGCTFTGNGNDDGNSGGVINGGKATLTGCTFTGNQGGGLSNTGNLTLTGCTFTGNTNKFVLSDGNTHTERDSYGGAVDIGPGSTAVLINCTLTGNTASYGGGVSNIGTVTLTNCIVVGNTATAGNGGGVLNFNNATIRFCSISDNVARTAVNQQSPAQGGALENDGTAVLTNDILWGNTAPYAAEIGTPVNGGQTTTATYCDIQGGLSGPGNIKANPLFVSTTNPIMPPIAVTNVGDADLHLQASSPCRGAGITIPPTKADPRQYNSKPDPGVSADADGQKRPNPPSIGAYEYSANPPKPKKVLILDLNSGAAPDAAAPSEPTAPKTPKRPVFTGHPSL